MDSGSYDSDGSSTIPYVEDDGERSFNPLLIIGIIGVVGVLCAGIVVTVAVAIGFLASAEESVDERSETVAIRNGARMCWGRIRYCWRGKVLWSRVWLPGNTIC